MLDNLREKLLKPIRNLGKQGMITEASLQEALKEIRSDDSLRDLPVVVLSTSRSEEDVEKSFNLGCNSFISKPSSFQGMADLMDELMHYWFETSEIPGNKGA